MSIVTLEIFLDDPKAVFYAGQPVTGTVLVSVHEACTCNALTVQLRWHTSGKGNRAEGGGGASSKALVAQGQWLAGDQHRFPFSVTAPSGPVTYHGHYINVDWVVDARADLSMAMDPKVKVPIAIVAAPGQTRKDLGLDHFVRTEGELAPQTRMTFHMVAALVMVLAMLLAYYFKEPQGFGPMSKDGTVGAVLIVSIGILWFVWALVKRRSIVGLGNPELTLEPSAVTPGGETRVGFRIAPTGHVALNWVRVVVTGQERAKAGSGTRARTFQHTFHSEWYEHPEGRGMVSAGEEKSFDWRVPIPENAPPSFDAFHNHVEWKLEVRVAMAGRKDYVQERLFTVLPPVGRIPEVS